jgi:hypothetical protein
VQVGGWWLIDNQPSESSASTPNDAAGKQECRIFAAGNHAADQQRMQQQQ